jgi:hypothetical protein
MTAKRKDNGDLEIIKMGGLTFTYRTALLLLLASVTPAGDMVWDRLGFLRKVKPDEVMVAQIQRESHQIQNKIASLESDLEDLREEFKNIKHKPL